MNAVGIIAEYNPFHNGHAWHVQEARRLSGCPGVVAVMSGHFLQRGVPASFDKWLRAEMAVLNGVDLVLELPTAFAVQSAQYFAEGGVRLLTALGTVTHIAFGAETADLSILQAAARSARDPLVWECCQDYLKEGQTYARAYTLSVSRLTGLDPAVLASPNNILAIEYLRAMETYAPSLVPAPVKRHTAHYHQAVIGSEDIASATAIRNELETVHSLSGALRRVLPPASAERMEDAIAQGRGPVAFAALTQALLFALRTMPLAKLAEIYGISEGLHYKLHEAALNAGSLPELLSAIKSKRYTATRLQRLFIHCLLGTTQAEMMAWLETGPLYARVLAFNDRGKKLLRTIRRSGSLDVIAKTADALSTAEIRAGNLSVKEKMLALDFKASDIFSLAQPTAAYRRGGSDLLRSPVYVKNSQSAV